MERYQQIRKQRDGKEDIHIDDFVGQSLHVLVNKQEIEKHVTSCLMFLLSSDVITIALSFLNDYQPVHVMVGHTQPVECLAVLPDGRVVRTRPSAYGMCLLVNARSLSRVTLILFIVSWCCQMVAW